MCAHNVAPWRATANGSRDIERAQAVALRFLAGNTHNNH